MISVLFNLIFGLLEIFLPLIIFLLAVYIMTVYVYKIFKDRSGVHISSQEARQWLNGIIKNMWNSWSKPPELPEPLASEIFISTLKCTLSDINAIDATLIRYDSGLNYLGQCIPFVEFFVLSDVDTATIEFACQKLEEAAKNFLLMSNYQNPLVWTHFEKYERFRYHIVLFYAVFPVAQERLMLYKRTKATIQETAFSRANRPVINPDLEKELEAMKNERKSDEK